MDCTSFGSVFWAMRFRPLHHIVKTDVPHAALETDTAGDA
jgi:hypothetical protein